MKQVVVTVTSQTVGEGEVYPYRRHLIAATLPLYLVPQYRIVMNGNRQFSALRFGLSAISGTPLKERICDVGLFTARTLIPSWVPGYSPHSFEGTGLKGAWLLLPGREFLMHEGAGTKEEAGASLGCIELAGADEWNRFLIALRNEAGLTSFADIGHKKLLRVDIEAAAPPKATYHRSFDIDGKHFFIEPTR